jgi:hypothetical protein
VIKRDLLTLASSYLGGERGSFDGHINKNREFIKRITIVNASMINNRIEIIGDIDKCIACVEYFSYASAEAAMISLDGTVVGGEKIKVSVESDVTKMHDGEVYENASGDDYIDKTKNDGDNINQNYDTENIDGAMIAMKIIQRFPPEKNKINTNDNDSNTKDNAQNKYNENNVNLNGNYNESNVNNTNDDSNNADDKNTTTNIDNINNVVKGGDKSNDVNVKIERHSQPVSLYKDIKTVPHLEKNTSTRGHIKVSNTLLLILFCTYTSLAGLY